MEEESIMQDEDLVIGAEATPDYEFKLSDYRYYTIESNLYIYSYIGNASQVKIPPSVDSYHIFLCGSVFKNNHTVCKIDISGVSINETAADMFMDCDHLEEVNLGRVCFAGVELVSRMFFRAIKLKQVDLSDANLTSVKHFSNMFDGCTSLECVKFNPLYLLRDVRNVEDMFHGCISLKELNLDMFETTKAKRLSRFCFGCSSLESVTAVNFTVDPDSVESIWAFDMFGMCPKLSILHLPKFNFTDQLRCDGMFAGCKTLTVEVGKILNEEVTLTVFRSDFDMQWRIPLYEHVSASEAFKRATMQEVKEKYAAL